jgi:hypothetical protein
MKKIFAAILMVCAFTGAVADQRAPFGTDTLSTTQKLCYSLGNIGYDSVVNADAGVPIEEALLNNKVDGSISLLVSNVVAGAYKWDHSPHEYAMAVYKNCTEMLPEATEDM